MKMNFLSDFENQLYKVEKQRNQLLFQIYENSYNNDGTPIMDESKRAKVQTLQKEYKELCKNQRILKQKYASMSMVSHNQTAII